MVKNYPEADYIINGGLYDTASGWSTADVVQDGSIVNGGNYTDKGFAFTGNSLKLMTTSEAINNGYQSFLGGSPNLIVDGDISIDNKGLGNWFCEIGKAKRLGIGINQEKDLIVQWTDDSTTIRDLASLMAENGAYEAIALDGGGSTNIFVKKDGKWEPVNEQTENRNVPTWILVYLKKPLTSSDDENLIIEEKKIAYSIYSGKTELQNLFADEPFLKTYVAGGISSGLELNKINDLDYLEGNPEDYIKTKIVIKLSNETSMIGTNIKTYYREAHHKKYAEDLGNSILLFSPVQGAVTAELDEEKLDGFNIVLEIYLDYWQNLTDYNNTLLMMFVNMVVKGLMNYEGRNLDDYKEAMQWSSYMGLPIAEQDYNLTYNSFIQIMSDYLFIVQKNEFLSSLK